MSKGRFRVYPLEGLYPEGERLVLDPQERILTRLASGHKDEQQCAIIEQARFTEMQLYLLDPLLAAYPDYCPLEMLLAAHRNENVERCRARLNQAFEAGTASQVLRGVYLILTACRPKMRALGLETRYITETGYMLFAANGQHR
jgi:hypothetical protein